METRGPWPDCGLGIWRESVVGLVAGDLMPDEPGKTQQVTAQLGSELAIFASAHHPACALQLGPPVVLKQRNEFPSVFLGHFSRLHPEIVLEEDHPLPSSDAKPAPPVVNIESRKLFADPQEQIPVLYQ